MIVRIVATTRNAVVVEVVCTGLLLSVTVVMKIKGPLPVGVPEIVPVDGAIVSPLGRVPEVIDQVYGALPPVAFIVCE